MAKKKNSDDRVMDVTAEPIHVTPTNPLFVNSTPIAYDVVLIEGGDITVTAFNAEVKFNQLQKVS